jgi:hypothetical protein
MGGGAHSNDSQVDSVIFCTVKGTEQKHRASLNKNIIVEGRPLLNRKGVRKAHLTEVAGLCHRDRKMNRESAAPGGGERGGALYCSAWELIWVG